MFLIRGGLLVRADDGVCAPSGFIHERLQQRPEIADSVVEV